MSRGFAEEHSVFVPRVIRSWNWCGRPGWLPPGQAPESGVFSPTCSRIRPVPLLRPVIIFLGGLGWVKTFQKLSVVSAKFQAEGLD